MLSGDCNVCINGKTPSYSATCVECGLSRKNFKPITNADRIRAMSDEELAGWLADHPVVSEYDENNPQHKGWLDWLKQEVKE